MAARPESGRRRRIRAVPRWSMVLIYSLATAYSIVCFLAALCGHKLRSRKAPAGWPRQVDLHEWGLCICAAFGQMSQAPMLPYLWRNSKGGDLGYGWWFFEFSMLQLIGNSCSGPFIDRLGARTFFALSNAAAAAMFGLTAVATNYWMLYLSRLPAILELGVLSAKTLIAERSEDHERARMLGYMGAALGFGVATGPIVGGRLSDISLQLCAWFAMAVSLPCIALAFAIPDVETADLGDEEHQPANINAVVSSSSPRAAMVRQGSGHEKLRHVSIAAAGENQERPSQSSQSAAAQFLSVCKLPGVPSILGIKVLKGLASSLKGSVTGLLLDRQFHLSTKEAGMVMSYLGLVSMVSQGVLVGITARRLSPRQAVLGFGWSLAASYLWMSASANSMKSFVATLAPTIICVSVLDTIATAHLTKIVPEGRRATALSAEAGVIGTMAAIAPVIATTLYHEVGFAVLGMTSCTLIVTLVLLVHARIIVL